MPNSPAALDQVSRASELTPAERRMCAAQYRQMAAGVVSADVRDALLRLAARHETLAAGGPGGDRSAGMAAD